MMDLQSALVCVVVFVVSAAVILLISMFGMKEKSYEEALAEQRQQNSGLLGPHTKPKPKEKKQKKAGKKVKEKQVTIVENEQAEESESTDTPSTVTTTKPTSLESEHHLHDLHVEFEEPTIVQESPPPAVVNKKRSKRDKVRPILVHHKDEKPIVVVDSVAATTANHFEQIHPKDEFERLHSHCPPKEEVVTKTEAPAPQTKEKSSKKHKSSKQQEPKEEVPPQEKPSNEKHVKSGKLQQAAPAPAPVPAPPAKPVEESPKDETPPPAVPQNIVSAPTNTVKDKKKKKSEFNTLQQLSGDRQSVNVSLLLPLVRKADLSRNEIQILIDLLLNKQQEASSFHDEWSEGKADPVQKLKRQLAEKEKALKDEQQTLLGAQAKLREIRAEQSAERTQLQQRVRGLEEALHNKQLEIQASTTRLQAQQQKMQQMQAQLNEEMVQVRKLREEQNGIQIQRQKMEMHLGSINEQAQEKDATIAALRAELQDHQARNNQLTMELRSFTEQTQTSKEHQQSVIAQYDHQVRQLEGQALHFKAEAEESARKMEETCAHISELERRLNAAHRQESELKMEVTRLTNLCQQNVEEVRRYEQNQQLDKEELIVLQQKAEDSNRLIVQLQADLQALQAEKSQIQAANANGNVAENKAHKLEIMNLHNELDSLRSQKQQQIEVLSTELENSKQSFNTLQKELEEQREKNNELRKKNWKVMDALNAAENSLRTKSLPSTVSSPVNMDEAVKKARQSEQTENRKLLQRILPDIDISSSATQEQWIESLESAIKKLTSDNQKTIPEPVQNNDGPEIQKLQSQIAHYKNIIDDTEGMLNKLQRNVEEEETRWRTESAEKEKEIDSLKTEINSNLRIQSELEQQLNEERTARQALGDECKTLKSCTDLNQVEKFTEEINRLQELLVREQSHNKQISGADLSTTKTAQIHNLTANGTTVTSEGAAK